MIFKFRYNFNLLYKSYYINLIGIPSAQQNELPGNSLCRILSSSGIQQKKLAENSIRALCCVGLIV